VDEQIFIALRIRAICLHYFPTHSRIDRLVVVGRSGPMTGKAPGARLSGCGVISKKSFFSSALENMWNATHIHWSGDCSVPYSSYSARESAPLSFFDSCSRPRSLYASLCYSWGRLPSGAYSWRNIDWRILGYDNILDQGPTHTDHAKPSTLQKFGIGADAQAI